MPRGFNATLIAPDPVHDEVHVLLQRNATEEDKRWAKCAWLGTSFQEKGITYRVIDVIRDDLNRLLKVGMRQEDKV